MHEVSWLRYFLFSLGFLGIVEGHMRMSYPPPIRSPEEGVNIDYDETSPLGVYPCKGFLGDPGHKSVATFASGSNVAVK
jgi:hypothetical protein